VLLNLHLLRAVAALAVVYFHTTSEAGLNLPVNIGGHGVDVFFVISGFIIAYIGARTPDRFFVRRLIRIVPFYWAATLAIFGAAALAPHLLRSTRADAVQLLCSLFFVPRETTYAGTVPTLVLGWSLNYEMYFYVVFALALAVAPKRAPIACSVAIAAIAIGISASGITHPSVRFYARPIVFEFVFGVCVYYLFAAAERHVAWFTERPALRWGLWAVALASVAAIGVEELHATFGWPRFLVAGVPALLLVLSALLLERAYAVRASSTTIFLVGESSYILYLTHPYVIYGLLRTTGAPRAALGWPATIGLVIGLMVASTVTAIVIHLWFERPIIAALRHRVLTSGTTPPSRWRPVARRGRSDDSGRRTRGIRRPRPASAQGDRRG
jgi:peptidoglycan/LPS O-acetylase OafA/YrhL